MDFFDIMSLIGAIVVIVLALVLTYYASRWYAKRMGAGQSGRYVKIVDRTVLSQGSAVYILKAGERYHLVGVADKNITYLSELPDFAEESGGNPPSSTSFSQVMRSVMGKGRNGGGDA